MDDEELVQVLTDFAQYCDENIVRPAVHDFTTAVERLTPPEPKKRMQEMLGEYLRDAAVLVLIFVPVDLLIPRSLNQQKPIEARWLLATLALSFAMLVVGILAERRS